MNDPGLVVVTPRGHFSGLLRSDLFEMRKSNFMLLACVTSGSAVGQPEGSTTWRQVVHEQEPSFYETKEAVRVADNFLLFQAEIGGWDKIDSKRISRHMLSILSKEQREALRKNPDQQCSLDNEATYTQMRFLARVFAATGKIRFKEGFLRGCEYLLAAQYENGGWPQFYPLRGGYSDGVTFNDSAMTGAIWLLDDVATGRVPFNLAEDRLRRRCRDAVERGRDCILRCQLVVGGKRTAWAQQYDAVTLKPAWGRVSEVPSIVSAESVHIVRYLMSVDRPSAEIREAIAGAVAWFDEVKVTGKRLITVKDQSLPGGTDRKLIKDSSAPPVWGRYYGIGSNRVLYIENGIVHYELAKLSHKHRVGHGWIGGRWPAALLEREYPAWKKKWGE